MMSDHITETAFWIRRRDKYREYWQCAKCGGTVVKNDQMTAPPVQCPFCRRGMSDKQQKKGYAMDDYIKREDAIDVACGGCPYNCTEVRKKKHPCMEYKELMAIPSADVAPIRRAHWIQEEYWSEGIGMGESYGHYYKCSACGKRVKLLDLYLDEYCRKCGAEMYEAKECERKRQEFNDMLAAKNKEWRG